MPKQNIRLRTTKSGMRVYENEDSIRVKINRAAESIERKRQEMKRPEADKKKRKKQSEREKKRNARIKQLRQQTRALLRSLGDPNANLYPRKIK